MNKYDARKRRGKKTKQIIFKSDRPRLVVHKSAANIYSQIVVRGDKGDCVLVSSSSLDKEVRQDLTGDKCDKALHVGKVLGMRAREKNISEVAFDRAGYKYHGRVKALADGAREAGLKF